MTPRPAHVSCACIVLLAALFALGGCSIGTDLVLDRGSGPQLLELNARPGLSIQVVNGAGLLPRQEYVEGLRERRRTTPAHRVDYAMATFAGRV